MKRLKFPSRLSNDVAFLIEHHMVNYSDAWTGAAVRRFMRKMGGRLDAVLSLAAADRRAHAPDVNIGTPVGEIRKRIARVAADMESRGVSFTPPLDGREIMEILDIGPGPEVGRAKEHLCQAVLGRGRPISRDEAARLIIRWATSAAAGESE
jgi:poly(A) polymerase